MGRGTVEHLSLLQTFRDHPQAVQIGADAPDTAGGVNFPDFAVARLLHGVDFLPTQQLNQQIVEKIRSRPQDDILRVNPHPPELP